MSRVGEIIAMDDGSWCPAWDDGTPEPGTVLHAQQPAQGEAVGEMVMTVDNLYRRNVVAKMAVALPVGTKLYTAPPATSVPDGWKLVPINATAAMLEVLKSARIHEWSTTRAVYAAMLAAAPEPPR